MTGRRTAALLVIALLLVGAPAWAHALGISLGVYTARGSSVLGTLTFARGELAALIPALDANHDGHLSALEVSYARPLLRQHVLDRVLVTSGPDTCAPALLDAGLTEEDGVVVRGRWDCTPGAAPFVIDLALLDDLAPGHRHIVGAELLSCDERRLTLVRVPDAVTPPDPAPPPNPTSRKQDGSTGFKRAEDAPLIAADPGPYKLAPTDPGGAAVAGISDSIAAAGRGDDAGGAIDITALPEEPLARPGTVAEPPTDLLPPAKATVPVAPPVNKVTTPLPPPVKAVAAPVVAPVAEKPKAKPIKPPPADAPKTAKPDPLADPAPPKPAAKSASGTALQLGAFSTEAKADAAWTTAVGHAPALGGLSKRIEPIERGGKTLYRLRAGGVASKAAADELCVKVKAGGDACLVAE